MTGHLSVQREDFQKALRLLERIAGSSKAKTVCLTFADSVLTLDCEGQSASLPATGRWSGSARLPLALVVRLRTRLPDCDPLPLELSDDSLLVDKIRLTAIPQEVVRADEEAKELEAALDSAARLLAPLKVTVADLRQLVDYKASADRRPPLRLVRRGEGRLPKPWGSRPRKAAELLRPWGVTESEIERLIRAALRRWAR